LRISGMTIEEQTTSAFFINTGESSHTEWVRVQPKPDANNSQVPPTATVSQASLKVPKKASKELDRGGEAFQQGDWKAAVEHYEKAIALYPEYAVAYNNLGSAYVKSGDYDKARESYEKAVGIDSHLASAYVNLARLLQVQKRLPEAEEQLSKALALEPTQPETLTMLALVQFREGKLDEAIANARKVHSGDPDPYPVAHYIAAVALQAKQDQAGAQAEYELFLKESPNDPNAPRARAALKELGKSR